MNREKTKVINLNFKFEHNQLVKHINKVPIKSC